MHNGGMPRPAERPGQPALSSITVRVNEEMKTFIKDQGGGKYIRGLVRKDAREKKEQR